MSILFLESFQWANSGLTGASLESYMDEKYDATVDVVGTDAQIVTAPSSRKAIQFGSTTSQFFRIDTGNTGTDFAMGARVKVGSSPASLFDLFQVRDTGSVEHLSLEVSSGLRLFVRRTFFTLGVVNADLREGEWAFIEFKGTIDNTTGSWEVRVNGTSVGSATGVDTRNAGSPEAAQFSFHNPNTSADWEITDIYIDDTDYHDGKAVYTLFPDADTASEDWALSAGSDSFALINEAPHDSDTTYISTATSTDRTMVDVDDTGGESGIVAVQINTIARLEAGGSEQFDHRSDTGGTVDTDTQTVTSTTYDHFYTVFDTANGAAAWTSGLLDSADFGVEYI